MNKFNSDMISLLLGNRKINPITKCWEWTGGRSHHKYGHIFYEGKYLLIHRISAYISLGLNLDDPEDFSCHKCDNPICFNPLHLFIGDRWSNVKDAVDKGRYKRSLPTHCYEGHEFTEENTYTRIRKKTVSRECIICRNKRRREVYLNGEKGVRLQSKFKLPKVFIHNKENQDAISEKQ